MSDKKQGKTSGDWATYRRLVQYAKPYWKRIVIGGVFGVIFGGSMAAMLAGLGKMAQMVFGESTENLELSLTSKLLIASIMPLFGIIRGVGDYLSTYMMEWVGNRVVMDLRTQTFAHLQDVSLAFYQRTKTGELISRIVNDSVLVERSVATVLADLVKQPASFVALVVLLIWNNALLALVGLVLFPICIIPVALFGRRVRKFAREQQEHLADVVSILQETISGVRIVKAFGMEQYEYERFVARCRSVFSRAMRVTRARASVEPVIVSISVIGLSIFLLFTGYMSVKVGEFLVFAGALVALYEPVKKMSKIHLQVQQSSAAADRIFELLDTEVTVKDRPDAVEIGQDIQSVHFDQVSFAYDTDLILNQVSFDIRSGQRIAFVGSSGAGKTTLVSLVPRFFDVTSGCIQINGKDIRAYTMKSLRGKMGIVTQDTFLFNDTIANNIAYGHRDASMDTIEMAAKKAHAHDFITAMPDGYQTMVGERGLRLSGGQKQRISIARALFRNPPILIMDEATSALDTESERQVQAALDELMEGRTVFAIAHRLSTIISSDVIIVLDKGQIVEQGSHKELLAKNGHYKYLYDLQFKDDVSDSAS